MTILRSYGSKFLEHLWFKLAKGYTVNSCIYKLPFKIVRVAFAVSATEAVGATELGESVDQIQGDRVTAIVGE